MRCVEWNRRVEWKAQSQTLGAPGEVDVSKELKEVDQSTDQVVKVLTLSLFLQVIVFAWGIHKGVST